MCCSLVGKQAHGGPNVRGWSTLQIMRLTTRVTNPSDEWSLEGLKEFLKNENILILFYKEKV